MNSKRAFIYIALLEGVAVATIGTAIKERNITSTSRVLTLVIIGIACLLLQLVIWRMSDNGRPAKESGASFFKKHSLAGLFLSSVVGLAAGTAVFLLI